MYDIFQHCVINTPLVFTAYIYVFTHHNKHNMLTDIEVAHNIFIPNKPSNETKFLGIV